MLDATAYVALSRQTALQRDMDIIANNLANMSTTGFKAEHVLFEEVLDLAEAPEELAFVQDGALVRDLAFGPLTRTGSDLDIGIDGPGYFSVEGADGRHFTRAGRFAINSDREIVNLSGDRLLDDGGSTIVLPGDGGEITVAEDGTLSVGEDVVARIGIVAFDDEQALEKVGDNRYRSEQVPRPLAAPRLAQGMLEGSNVNAILEMTTMMETVRAFQGTQKLIETHHDLERRAIEQMLEVKA